MGSWVLLNASQLQMDCVLALMAEQCSFELAAVGSWVLQNASQLHLD